MPAKSLDVMPGVGIGGVRFGMRPEQIAKLIDEPTKWEDWMGGNLNDAILFHGLRFHFDRFDSHGPLVDSSLTELFICGREDALLYGRPLHDWTKRQISAHMASIGLLVAHNTNGDIDVANPIIGMSFDRENRLVWLELEASARSNKTDRTMP